MARRGDQHSASGEAGESDEVAQSVGAEGLDKLGNGAEERESGSVETRKPPSQRFQVPSAILNLLMTVLQTSLIAWFGFTLSGRLELALKEREATIDAAKVMGDLIVKLRDEQLPDDADRSLMLRLAMYGEDAIGPMVMMAMTPGTYGAEIPIFGLQRLGIMHRDSTCKALAAALASDAWIQDSVRKPLLDKLSKEMRC